MNTILRIVNYLNYGNSKGDSLGFSLDTVKSLDKVMGKSKHSLLFFCVKTVQANNPAILKFLENYNDIEVVTKMEISEF